MTPKPLPAELVAFGARIEAYRLARNITQDQLAKSAGLSRSTFFTRFEAQVGRTTETLIRLLQALGLGERLALLLPEAKPSPLSGPRQRARPRPRPATRQPWGDEA